MSATETATVTTTYTAEPCHRFPCDHAYRRQQHVVDEDGHVVHRCGVLDGYRIGSWEVALIAEDEGQWQVGVSLWGAPYVPITEEGETFDGDGRVPPEVQVAIQFYMSAMALGRAITLAAEKLGRKLICQQAIIAEMYRSDEEEAAPEPDEDDEP